MKFCEFCKNVEFEEKCYLCAVNDFNNFEPRNLPQANVKPQLCEVRTFTKDDLQAAFHSGICFGSEKHGGEQDSFERWFSDRFA